MRTHKAESQKKESKRLRRRQFFALLGFISLWAKVWYVFSLVQEVLELQVQMARLNAKLDEAENARRVLDTARRDLDKDINIKVDLVTFIYSFHGKILREKR